MPDAPEQLPRWADDPGVGAPGRIEPPEGLKDDGWSNGQRPPAPYMNWLDGVTSDWVRYLSHTARQGAINAFFNQRLVNTTATDAFLAIAGDASTDPSSVIVMAGENGQIRRRAAGVDTAWAGVTAGGSFADDFRGACFDPVLDAFFLVGDNREIQTAPAVGTPFTHRAPPTAASIPFYSCASNGAGVVVAASTFGYGARATGVSTWANISGVVHSIVRYGNGRFVSVVDGAYSYSVDQGVTWVDVNTLVPFDVAHDMVYSPRLGFVVLGYPNICTSPDGVTWTVHGTVPELAAGSKLVVIGRTIIIFQPGNTRSFLVNRSDDLSDIVAVPWLLDANIRCALVRNGVLWTGGEGGHIYASPLVLG